MPTNELVYTGTMKRDAQSTRQRILDAATAEFAQYGIAGARVDRIAAASGSNKSMIYAYYTSKDQLFDAVFDAIIVRNMHDVPVDAHDLPEYAARLFDQWRAYPEVLRLGTWDWLERGAQGAQNRRRGGGQRAQSRRDPQSPARRRGQRSLPRRHTPPADHRAHPDRLRCPQQQSGSGRGRHTPAGDQGRSRCPHSRLAPLRRVYPHRPPSRYPEIHTHPTAERRFNHGRDRSRSSCPSRSRGAPESWPPAPANRSRRCPPLCYKRTYVQ